MRNKNAKVSDPNSFVSCPGDRIHILRSPSVEPDGSFTLIETGKEDIQDLIDSYRPQTDMSFILKQLALGDTSVLSAKTPMFGDFSQMPTSYAEALQLVIDAEQQFYSLPLEVRNKFDNDYRKWFATSGSDVWFDKMADVIPKSSDNSDVKEDIVE